MGYPTCAWTGHRGRASVALGLVLLAGLAGCATAGPSPSAFLRDYGGLNPSPTLAGAWRWTHPTRFPGAYGEAAVQPVELRFLNESERDQIDPARLAEVVAYLQQQLQAQLARRYQLVTTPGPSSLQLRVAVTRVQPAASTTHLAATAGPGVIHLGAAQLEADLRETRTGTSLLLLVYPLGGGGAGRGQSLPNAKEAVDRWVEGLMQELDAARSAAPEHPPGQ